jgi:hypothetical protein
LGVTRYGFNVFTNSLATLVAPPGPENGPYPVPEASTTLVFWCLTANG